MKILTGIFSLALLLSVSACASTVVATQPENSARIKNTMHRESLFVWKCADVISVDQQFLDHTWKQSATITKGKHVATIQVMFNHDFSHKPQGAIVSIPFVAQAGEEYHAEFTINAAVVSVWIVDAKQKHVSDSVKMAYGAAYSGF